MTEEDFEKYGMAVTLHANDKSPKNHKTFYEICSPTSSYKSPFLETKDWESQLQNYDVLTKEEKTEVNNFIMGLATDNFYCGSKMQLSFPLEDAVRDARKNGTAPCLDKLDGISKEQKYNILFHQAVAADKSLFDKHATVKSVIAESLSSGVLCRL